MFLKRMDRLEIVLVTIAAAVAAGPNGRCLSFQYYPFVSVKTRPKRRYRRSLGLVNVFLKNCGPIGGSAGHFAVDGTERFRPVVSVVLVSFLLFL